MDTETQTYAVETEPPEIDQELEEALSAFYTQFYYLHPKAYNAQRAGQQERNAKCVCESGKKAKKCCATPGSELIVQRYHKCRKFIDTGSKDWEREGKSTPEQRANRALLKLAGLGALLRIGR